MGRLRSVSGSSGMYLDGTALKGQLCNNYLATTVGEGADGSTLTDGSYMFQVGYGPAALTSWAVDLPNLENGSYMFDGCLDLASFSGGMPNLTNGYSMFNYCSSLTSFTGDLPNLTDGSYMFANCNSLTSFSGDLPKLTSGYSMFNYCPSLTSFSGDLSNLAGTSSYDGGGNNMFSGCSKLTSFNSTLPVLAYGQNMFSYCILDEASVLRILNSIPTYTSGTHPLHLGRNTNYKYSADIATLLGTTTPIAASTKYKYKGWTITVTT